MGLQLELVSKNSKMEGSVFPWDGTNKFKANGSRHWGRGGVNNSIGVWIFFSWGESGSLLVWMIISDLLEKIAFGSL